MSRGRRPARDRALEAYKEYVRPVIADPLGDHPKLTVRGLRDVSGLGNDTIYKYGLNERLKRVVRWRKRRRGEDAGSSGSRARIQLKRSREQRDEYRAKYEALLEKWLTLKYVLQDRRDLDIEELVRKHPLAKPARQVGPDRARKQRRER